MPGQPQFPWVLGPQSPSSKPSLSGKALSLPYSSLFYLVLFTDICASHLVLGKQFQLISGTTMNTTTVIPHKWHHFTMYKLFCVHYHTRILHLCLWMKVQMLRGGAQSKKEWKKPGLSGHNAQVHHYLITPRCLQGPLCPSPVAQNCGWACGFQKEDMVFQPILQLGLAMWLRLAMRWKWQRYGQLLGSVLTGRAGLFLFPFLLARMCVW